MLRRLMDYGSPPYSRKEVEQAAAGVSYVDFLDSYTMLTRLRAQR